MCKSIGATARLSDRERRWRRPALGPHGETGLAATVPVRPVHCVAHGLGLEPLAPPARAQLPVEITPHVDDEESARQRAGQHRRLLEHTDRLEADEPRLGGRIHHVGNQLIEVAEHSVVTLQAATLPAAVQ